MHPNATTNRQKRNYIKNSDKSVADLSIELNVSRNTIRKWKSRESTEDKSHSAINLHTTLNRPEESFLMFLRYFLRLSIDDLHIISKKFINSPASRSGIGRLIKRKRNLKEDTDKIHRTDIKTIKILIFKLKKDNIYLISSTNKSKMLNCAKLDPTCTGDIVREISSHLDNNLPNRIYLSEESYNFEHYLELITNIFSRENILVHCFSDLSIEEFTNTNALLLLGDKNFSGSSEKYYKLESKIRIFQYIFNYKTKLRSLRNNTPSGK